jgi:pimeloyl-ACP methyl ester carboxylesterase
MTQLQTTPGLGTYWQWREQSIYYVRSGEARHDRAPLLFIHGFGASTDHWRKNLTGLEKDFEVWAIDLLGFGRSAKPNWEYSGDLWRDQLHDFITNVIGKPVILVGNSLGGYSSLCLGAQRPSSALGLVLINSAGPFSETTPKPEPPLLKKIISSVIGSLFRKNLVSFLLFQYVRQKSIIRKTLQKVYLDQSAVTEQLVEEIYRPARDRGASQVFASVFRTKQGAKVDELLQQLKCPLLMIWGEGDPWMNCRERSAKFRQYYPTLKEHFINAGHCPHDEVPEEVNQLIKSWVFSDVLIGDRG